MAGGSWADLRGLAAGAEVPSGCAVPLLQRRVCRARRARGPPPGGAVGRGRGQQGLLRPLGMARTTTRPRSPRRRAGACTRSPTSCTSSPSTTPGPWPRPVSSGRPSRTSSRWAAFLAGDTAGLLAPETLERDVPAHRRQRRPRCRRGPGPTAWAGRSGTSTACATPATAARCPASWPGCGSTPTPATACVVFANATSGLRPSLAERPAGPPGRARAGAAAALVGRRRAGSHPRPRRRVVLGHRRLHPAPDRATDTSCWASPGAARGRGSGPPRPAGSASTATTRASCSPSCTTRRAGSSHLDLGSFRFTRTPYDPAADIPGDVHPARWH